MPRRHAIELVARERPGVVGELLHRPAAERVDPLARRASLARAPAAARAPASAMPTPSSRTSHCHVVPARSRCMWLSMSPGITVRPRRSMRRVAGPGQRATISCRADAQDPVAPDRHRLGDREALVHRDDLAVGQDDVGAARARGRRFLRGEPRGRASRQQEPSRRDASPDHEPLPFVLENVEAGVPVARCTSAPRASRRRRRSWRRARRWAAGRSASPAAAAPRRRSPSARRHPGCRTRARRRCCRWRRWCPRCGSCPGRFSCRLCGPKVPMAQ